MTQKAPRQLSEGQNLEFNIGTQWFSRIGIVLLLVGLAMTLNYTFPAYKHLLTPEVKIIMGALLSGGLFTTGSWLYKKFQLLGRILQGGGLSMGYLTLFGMFFIPAVQLFDAPALGWSLLCGYVATMILTSRKLNSLTMASLALGFGYYTASYSDSQLVSFAATLLLGGGVMILANTREGWSRLTLVGMAGYLLTLLNWMWQGFPGLDVLGNVNDYLVSDHIDEQLYVLANFAIFQLGAIIPAIRNKNQHIFYQTPFLAINTFTAYMILLATALVQQPSLFDTPGLMEAIFAAVHALGFIAFSSVARRNGELTESSTPVIQAKVHLLIAGIFTALSVMGLFAGITQPLVFAACAVLFAISGRDGIFRSSMLFASIMALIGAFMSLATFSWLAIDDLSLMLTVGGVAFAALYLEHAVYKFDDLAATIVIALISVLTFVAAIFTGLENAWVTITLVATGATLLTAGFGAGLPKFRWMGLLFIGLSLFHLVFVDIISLEMPYKILAFLGLGAVMLAGSYGYNLLTKRMEG